MPPTVVTVWFDYACPHSYVGLKQLEESAAELEFEIDRQPFLLRQESIQKPVAQGVDQGSADDSRRQPLYRLGESIGTEPASNRSISTLAVHAATAYAKERGLDREFFWAASKEYWELGTDLDNLYTLRRLAVSVGLDWQKMWPELESGGYHRLVIEQHAAALEVGVERTPSFQVGTRIHSGPISREELRTAVQSSA